MSGEVHKGLCTPEEKKLQINVLELMADKLVIKTFTATGKDDTTIHLQTDIITALSHFLKMGGGMQKINDYSL